MQKGGPDDYSKLRTGEPYVEFTGKPRTTRVTSVEDMHELPNRKHTNEHGEYWGFHSEQVSPRLKQIHKDVTMNWKDYE